MRGLFQTILRAMDGGQDAVLVSVAETSGSTPRGAGAHMLADEDGLLWGTVGGGPVEGRALELCRRVLESRRGCTERFVLRDDSEQGIGSVCGGEVTLYLHLVKHGDNDARAAAELALDCLTRRRQCWLAVGDPEAGGTLAVYGGGEAGGNAPGAVLPYLPDGPVLMGGRLLVQPLLREERVFIFGGGHVAQALAPVLAEVGFRCTVVEDRPEFCDPALFPDAEDTRLLPLDGWGEALAVTERDYLCIMTRGHERDIDCLVLALGTPARYIGLMGSRRKIAWTNQQLRQRGFSDGDISRIVTPIGLPIGAETPAEIAVSIAAQMILVRAKGTVN